MHDDEDLTLNAKAIGLAVGGATLAAALFLLARREKLETPAERMRSAVEDASQEVKKAGKKRRRELEEASGGAAERIADDARAAERELKAAAWDAQQQAREAESRLRAAGLRVVDDASHLASRFGSEARHLAGEGRERLAHLRHRDGGEAPLEDEIARLRAEIDDLRKQLGRGSKRSGRDASALTSRLAAKGIPISDAMVSQAAAAGLANLERAFKAKAPALIAARNRAQVMEILQQDLAPTLRDTITQAAAAAMAQWEAARETAREQGHDAQERAGEAASAVEEAVREARETARARAEEARVAAEEAAAAVKANGKHRLRFGHHEETTETLAEAKESAEHTAQGAAESVGHGEESRRGNAGLLWGGAGVGLALYALMDPERREQVLRLANEASVQLKELVRDLQGYDDEF